jgi:hypothetical protein
MRKGLADYMDQIKQVCEEQSMDNPALWINSRKCVIFDGRILQCDF